MIHTNIKGSIPNAIDCFSRKRGIRLLSLSVYFILFFLFTIVTARSQEDNVLEKHARSNPELIRLGNSATYDIEYKLTFKKTAPGQVTKFILRVTVPKDIPPIQEIVEMDTIPDHTKIEIDNNGNSIAYFYLGPGEFTGNEKEFILRYRARVTGYKVVKVPKEGQVPDFFIEPEKYIESDNPRIIETSNSICFGKNTTWDKTRAIYDFVRRNIKYKYSYDDLGALFALDNRWGDCTDFAYLMIALCRTQEIPARFVNSFFYDQSAPSKLHNWLEVYMPEFGWVPMDPEEGRFDDNAYFAGKTNNTVIWYVVGSSNLLEGGGQYYWDYYWKDSNPHIEVTRSINITKIE
jgi:transglutaminase-like putative cysteine protease